MKRTFSFFLALLFTWETAAWSAPAAPTVTLAGTRLQELQIPPALGSIQERFLPKDADPGAPGIIHIQDAHSHPEAQRNIQKILDDLARRNVIGRIALEGAFGKIDPEIFDFFSYPEINREIVEHLLSLGELTGAELFAFNRRARSVRIHGVDDRRLYHQSFALFRRIKKREPRTLAALQLYLRGLELLENRHLNEDLKKLVLEKRRRETREGPFLEYLEILRKLALKNLKLDLRDPKNQFEWPQLVRVMKLEETEPLANPERLTAEIGKLGRLVTEKLPAGADRERLLRGSRAMEPSSARVPGFDSWRQFFEFLYRRTAALDFSLLDFPNFLAAGGRQILLEEIEADGLFKEVARIEKRLEERLAKTSFEKEILRLGRDFLLLEKLLTLRMTREDFEEYQSRRSNLASVPGISEQLTKWAGSFYRLSRKRDQVLLNRTLQGRGARSKAVVLITGGFHTPGLTRLFREKKIPYLVIRPEVGQEENGRLYEKVMLGALVAKLLAQPPAEFNLPSGDPDPRQAEVFRREIEKGARVLSKKGLAQKIHRELARAFSGKRSGIFIPTSAKLSERSRAEVRRDDRNKIKGERGKVEGFYEISARASSGDPATRNLPHTKGAPSLSSKTPFPETGLLQRRSSEAASVSPFGLKVGQNAIPIEKNIIIAAARASLAKLDREVKKTETTPPPRETSAILNPEPTHSRRSASDPTVHKNRGRAVKTLGEDNPSRSEVRGGKGSGRIGFGSNRVDLIILRATSRLVQEGAFPILQNDIARRARVRPNLISLRKEKNPKVKQRVDTATEMTRSDVKILQAIKDLRGEGWPFASQSRIAKRAGISRQTLDTRKKANSAVREALREPTSGKETDSLILQAIASLAAAGEEGIGKGRIAEKAGITSLTLNQRMARNSKVKEAIDQATFFNKSDIKILKAVNLLDQAQEVPLQISQKEIARAAGVSPLTVSNRKKKNPHVWLAIQDLQSKRRPWDKAMIQTLGSGLAGEPAQQEGDSSLVGRQVTAEDAPGLPGVSGAVPARGFRPRAGGGEAKRSSPLIRNDGAVSSRAEARRTSHGRAGLSLPYQAVGVQRAEVRDERERTQAPILLSRVATRFFRSGIDILTASSIDGLFHRSEVRSGVQADRLIEAPGLREEEKAPFSVLGDTKDYAATAYRLSRSTIDPFAFLAFLAMGVPVDLNLLRGATAPVKISFIFQVREETSEELELLLEAPVARLLAQLFGEVLSKGLNPNRVLWDFAHRWQVHLSPYWQEAFQKEAEKPRKFVFRGLRSEVRDGKSEAGWRAAILSPEYVGLFLFMSFHAAFFMVLQMKAIAEGERFFNSQLSDAEHLKAIEKWFGEKNRPARSEMRASVRNERVDQILGWAQKYKETLQGNLQQIRDQATRRAGKPGIPEGSRKAHLANSTAAEIKQSIESTRLHVLNLTHNVRPMVKFPPRTAGELGDAVSFKLLDNHGTVIATGTLHFPRSETRQPVSQTNLVDGQFRGRADRIEVEIAPGFPLAVHSLALDALKDLSGTHPREVEHPDESEFLVSRYTESEKGNIENILRYLEILGRFREQHNRVLALLNSRGQWEKQLAATWMSDFSGLVRTFSEFSLIEEGKRKGVLERFDALQSRFEREAKKGDEAISQFFNEMRDLWPSGKDKVLANAQTFTTLINWMHTEVEQNVLSLNHLGERSILDLVDYQEGQASPLWKFFPPSSLESLKLDSQNGFMSGSNILLNEHSLWIRKQLGEHRVQIYGDLRPPELGGSIEVIYFEGGKTDGNIYRNILTARIFKKLGFSVDLVEPSSGSRIYGLRAKLSREEGAASVGELAFKLKFILEMILRLRNVDHHLWHIASLFDQQMIYKFDKDSQDIGLRSALDELGYRNVRGSQELDSLRGSVLQTLYRDWSNLVMKSGGRFVLTEIPIAPLVNLSSTGDEFEPQIPSLVVDGGNGLPVRLPSGEQVLAWNPRIPYMHPHLVTYLENAPKIYGVLNGILASLGLPAMPPYSAETFDPFFVEMHFNQVISQAIDSGRIISQDGEWRRNSQYEERPAFEHFVDFWDGDPQMDKRQFIQTEGIQTVQPLKFGFAGRVGGTLLLRADLSLLEGNYEVFQLVRESDDSFLGALVLNSRHEPLTREAIRKLFIRNHLGWRAPPDSDSPEMTRRLAEIEMALRATPKASLLIGRPLNGFPLLPGMATGRITFSLNATPKTPMVLYEPKITDQGINLLSTNPLFVGVVNGDGNPLDHFNTRLKETGKPRIAFGKAAAPMEAVSKNGFFLEIGETVPEKIRTYRGYRIASREEPLKDPSGRSTIRLVSIREGDLVTLDGTSGTIYWLGSDARLQQAFEILSEMSTGHARSDLEESTGKLFRFVNDLIEKGDDSGNLDTVKFILQQVLLSGGTKPGSDRRTIVTKLANIGDVDAFSDGLVTVFRKLTGSQYKKVEQEIKNYLKSLFVHLEHQLAADLEKAKQNIAVLSRVDQVYYEIKQIHDEAVFFESIRSVLKGVLEASDLGTLTEEEVKRQIREAAQAHFKRRVLKLVSDIDRFTSSDLSDDDLFILRSLNERMIAFDRLGLPVDEARREKVGTPLEKLENQRRHLVENSRGLLSLPFASLDTDFADLVGNKGANLGWLKKFLRRFNNGRFQMAEGDVLTGSAYQLLLQQIVSGETLEQRIQQTLSSNKTNEEKAGRIREYFLSLRNSFPEPLRSLVQKLIAHREKAVRSTTKIEDDVSASAAGLFVSTLGLKTLKEAEAAILETAASLFSKEALEYRETVLQRKASVAERQGIIVQNLVDADVSGVVSSAGISTGNRRIVTINAGYGLGPTIVKSIQDADIYLVDKATGGVRSVKGSKLRKLVRRPDGRIDFEDTTTQERESFVLTEEMVRDLTEIAVAAEEWYGYVVQIEFSVKRLEKGRYVVYPLQIRPVSGFKVFDNERKLLNEWLGFKAHRQRSELRSATSDAVPLKQSVAIIGDTYRSRRLLLELAFRKVPVRFWAAAAVATKDRLPFLVRTNRRIQIASEDLEFNPFSQWQTPFYILKNGKRLLEEPIVPYQFRPPAESEESAEDLVKRMKAAGVTKVVLDFSDPRLARTRQKLHQLFLDAGFEVIAFGISRVLEVEDGSRPVPKIQAQVTRKAGEAFKALADKKSAKILFGFTQSIEPNNRTIPKTYNKGGATAMNVEVVEDFVRDLEIGLGLPKNSGRVAKTMRFGFPIDQGAIMTFVVMMNQRTQLDEIIQHFRALAEASPFFVIPEDDHLLNTESVKGEMGVHLYGEPIVETTEDGRSLVQVSFIFDPVKMDVESAAQRILGEEGLRIPFPERRYLEVPKSAGMTVEERETFDAWKRDLEASEVAGIAGNFARKFRVEKIKRSLRKEGEVTNEVARLLFGRPLSEFEKWEFLYPPVGRDRLGIVGLAKTGEIFSASILSATRFEETAFVQEPYYDSLRRTLKVEGADRTKGPVRVRDVYRPEAGLSVLWEIQPEKDEYEFVQALQVEEGKETVVANPRTVYQPYSEDQLGILIYGAGGRIGSQVLRLFAGDPLEIDPEREVSSLSGKSIPVMAGVGSLRGLAKLLRADPTAGPFQGRIAFKAGEDRLELTPKGGSTHAIAILSHEVFRDPENFPSVSFLLAKIPILAVEATGQESTFHFMRKLSRSGAESVVLPNPGSSKEEGWGSSTLVYNVNAFRIEDGSGVTESGEYHPRKKIVSNGSCTTCGGVAGMDLVLRAAANVQAGQRLPLRKAREYRNRVTATGITDHSYTQEVKGEPQAVDLSEKSQGRLAAAGAAYLAPTGYARNAKLVIPESQGSGVAIRGPWETGSHLVQVQDVPGAVGTKDLLEVAADEEDSEAGFKFVQDLTSSYEIWRNGGEWSSLHAVANPEHVQTISLTDNWGRERTIVILPTWYENEWGFSAGVARLIDRVIRPARLHSSKVDRAKAFPASLSRTPEDAEVLYSDRAYLTDYSDDELKKQFGGKKVFFRADLNVVEPKPVAGKRERVTMEPEIKDEFRILAMKGDVERLLKAGAKVVIASHNGRFKDIQKDRAGYVLDPVFDRLKELLPDRNVKYVAKASGPEVQSSVDELKDGEALLLGNLRDDPGEEAGDPHYAEAIYRAVRPDVIVFGAFGAAHRGKQASVGPLINIHRREKPGAPVVGAELIERELKGIQEFLSDPEAGAKGVALLGGAKLDEKIEVMREIIQGRRVQKLIVLGAMSFYFRLAQGRRIGNSFLESKEDEMADLERSVQSAFDILQLAEEMGVELILPEGHRGLFRSVDKEFPGPIDSGEIKRFPAEDEKGEPMDLPAGFYGYTVDKETVRRIKKEIEGASWIVLNGTAGLVEVPEFRAENDEINEVIDQRVKQGGVKVLLLGGDGVAAFTNWAKEEGRYGPDYLKRLPAAYVLSTGGGASLTLISELQLSALEFLDIRRRARVALGREAPIGVYVNLKDRLQTPEKLKEHVRRLVGSLKGIVGAKGVEVVVYVPSYLAENLAVDFELMKEIKESPIKLGVQNVRLAETEETSEVTAEEAKELGFQHVMIGHSDRRKLPDETPEIINQRVKSVLKAGLVPLVLFGENLEERFFEFEVPDEMGQAALAQLLATLEGVSAEEALKITYGYEPWWAIGKNPATSAYANAVIREVREGLEGHFKGQKDPSQGFVFGYGGGANETNIGSFLSRGQIFFGLLGRASMDPWAVAQTVQQAVQFVPRSASGESYGLLAVTPSPQPTLPRSEVRRAAQHGIPRSDEALVRSEARLPTGQEGGRVERLAVTVKVGDVEIEIREGGNYSIDISRAPGYGKVDAMRDFLKTNSYSPIIKGAYYGNQNQNSRDRDAEMAKIQGLQVFGVDANQENVVSEVKAIGAGTKATLRHLKETLGLLADQLPKFLGFDIDGTLLGIRPDGSKEELLKDQRGLADALVQLIVQGVHLAFFSDNDSLVTRDRIGEPLRSLVKALPPEKISLTERITFYTSGMATKFELPLDPSVEEIRYDETYGRKHRLPEEVVGVVSEVLGGVVEDDQGAIQATGKVGAYYEEKLTQWEGSVRALAKRILELYPGFELQKTKHSHVIPPKIEHRDPWPDGSRAQVAVFPIPSRAVKGHKIPEGKEDDRRQLFNDIVKELEQRSEVRSSVPRPRMRLVRVVEFRGRKLVVTEGGNMTIDIYDADAPTKTDAVRQFLRDYKLQARGGIYIGSQTSSFGSRDGELVLLRGSLDKELVGIRVMAVDPDQESVMPGAERIGPGIDSTRAKLQEILRWQELPSFIAFSGDDVVIGRKPVQMGSQTILEKGKLVDREAITDSLLAFVRQEVQIGFFSANSLDNLKDNVATPLQTLLNQNSIGKNGQEIAFYASGMTRRYKLVKRNGEWKIEDDPSYGKEYFLPPEITKAFAELIGGVREVPDGQKVRIRAEGLLGRYYTERLAQRTEGDWRYKLRDGIRLNYPRFDGGTTEHGNVGPPEIQFRDGSRDAGATQIAVRPFPTTMLLPPSTDSRLPPAKLNQRDEDERNRFFWAIVHEIELKNRGQSSASKSSEAMPLDERMLVGQELVPGVKLTPHMLWAVKQLMGVRDLILDQRLSAKAFYFGVTQAGVEKKLLELGFNTESPTKEQLEQARQAAEAEALNHAEKRALQEAEERALRALKAMHKRLHNLKNEGIRKYPSSLEAIVHEPGLFQELFGVRPIFVAAGFATRFSKFLHKTLTQGGLEKNNIGLALEGSYRTPGVRPAVVIGEKILGQLVRDESVKGFDEKRKFFKVIPEISEFPGGIRIKELNSKYLDSEKVRRYLGINPEEAIFFLTKPLGHGDHMIQVVRHLVSNLERRGETEAAPYVQLAFGEMSTAIDPSLANASLITYLDIIGKEADALAAGKLSGGEIEAKGNFFFSNDPKQLMAYTDWAHIPHRKKMTTTDRVAEQFGEEARRLIEELKQDESSQEPDKLKRIQELRKKHPYFFISDDGVVFTQEVLIEKVLEQIWNVWEDPDKKTKRKSKLTIEDNRWAKLPNDVKDWIRRHFAIFESEDGSYADILISTNTAIFKTGLVSSLFEEVGTQFGQGFGDHLENPKEDRRWVNRFWSIDPKTGETLSLAWNIFGMISDRNFYSPDPAGKKPKIGFTYAGNTPSSIKDPKRQIEFSNQMFATHGRPVSWHPPLTLLESQVFHAVIYHLRQPGALGNTEAVIKALRGLLIEGSYLSGFRHVVHALLAESHNEEWQWKLLNVLDRIKNPSPGDSSVDRSPVGVSLEVTRGLIDLLIAEAVDNGIIGGNAEALVTNPDYAKEVVKLRNAYARDVRGSGKEDEYLLRRLSQTLGERIFAYKRSLGDLLAIRERFDLEHPVEGDIPVSSSPLPQVVAITGGTSFGTLWVDVLSLLGLLKKGSRPRKVDPGKKGGKKDGRVLSVVGNTDDGGSSYVMVTNYKRAGFGYLPPPGDKGNSVSGMMTEDKRRHLMGDGGRIDKGTKAKTMEEAVLDPVQKTIADPNVDLAIDFFYFTATVFASMRNVDEINKRIGEKHEESGRTEKAPVIPLGGASIRNLYITGFLKHRGFLENPDPRNKGRSAVDNPERQAAYAQAMDDMVRAAGLEGFRITVSSFDPKTLYGVYSGYTLLLLRGDPANPKPEDQKEVLVIEKGDKQKLQITNPSPQGKRVPLSHSISSGESLTPQAMGIQGRISIHNQEGEIVLEIDGKKWLVNGKNPNAIQLDSLGHEAAPIDLSADGTGRKRELERDPNSKNSLFELSDGTKLYIRGPVVKRQTNQTETVNYATIEQVGLLEGREMEGRVPPAGRPVSLEANFNLQNSQIEQLGAGDLIVIGPGSFFTSILPHFLVEGMVKSLRVAKNRGAKVIFVMNATIDNETVRYKPNELLRKIEETIQTLDPASNLKLDDFISHVIAASPDERLQGKSIPVTMDAHEETILKEDASLKAPAERENLAARVALSVAAEILGGDQKRLPALVQKIQGEILKNEPEYDRPDLTPERTAELDAKVNLSVAVQLLDAEGPFVKKENLWRILLAEREVRKNSPNFEGDRLFRRVAEETVQGIRDSASETWDVTVTNTRIQLLTQIRRTADSVEKIRGFADWLQAVYPRIDVAIRTNPAEASEAAKKSRSPIYVDTAEARLISEEWQRLKVVTVPPSAIKVAKVQKRKAGEYDYRPLYDALPIARALAEIMGWPVPSEARSELRTTPALLSPLRAEPAPRAELRRPSLATRWVIQYVAFGLAPLSAAGNELLRAFYRSALQIGTDGVEHAEAPLTPAQRRSLLRYQERLKNFVEKSAQGDLRSNPSRTVVILEHRGKTARVDLDSMDLKPGDRLVVLSKRGSRAFSRYQSVAENELYDTLVPSVEALRRIFGKNKNSIPILILPPNAEPWELDLFRRAADREGLLVRMPRRPKAASALAHFIGHELPQEITRRNSWPVQALKIKTYEDSPFVSIALPRSREETFAAAYLSEMLGFRAVQSAA